MNDKIIAAHAKGFGAEAISRMLGVSLQDVIAAIPNDSEQDSEQEHIERTPYSKESMRTLANEALHALLADIVAQPSAFKPNEIIAAAREALDRTDGKPIQSSIVTGNAAIHIIGHVMPPASRLDVIDNIIEGEVGG